MPDPARAGLISVVGGECTGKSTLAAALGARLPALVVEEFLRDWVERHGRVPLAAEQAGVMAGHQRREASAAGRAARAGMSWVVSDSGPLMTAVYSIQYYDDASLLPQALQWASLSGLVVWCQDDLPWQPDPQRDGSHARATSQEILAGIFAGNPSLSVLPVSGSLDERITSVVERIRP